MQKTIPIATNSFLVLGTRIPSVAGYSLFFYSKHSILTFLSALSLFMAFERSSIGYVKWINVVASATFGVYLIHDNVLVRSFLWQEVFKNAQYQDSVFLIPYSVIVTVIVYIVCTLIDLLRQYTIEKPIMLLVGKTSEKITKTINAVIKAVSKGIFGKED